MRITCKNCNTVFNLPDDKAKPGIKLRCTICKNVFTLPEESPTLHFSDDEKNFPSNKNDTLTLDPSSNNASEEKTKKKKSNKGVIFFILLCILGTAGWNIWTYTDLANPLKEFISTKLGTSPQEAFIKIKALLPFLEEEKVETPKEIEVQNEVEAPKDIKSSEEAQLLSLQNVRQYTLLNEKVGTLAIIEGEILNNSSATHELIKLECLLYDVEGKPVLSKSQYAGNKLSLLQLQSLGESEIEEALSNKIDIIANNSNVQPNTVVPFMFVIYNPPAEAAEFGVKVIDTKL